MSRATRARTRGHAVGASSWLAALTLLAATVGCTDEDAQEIFARRVVPVLELRCAATACHGVPPSLDPSSLPFDEPFLLPTNARGAIRDVAAARRAALRYVNAVDGPGLSTLLRKPLPAWEGGRPHAGGDNFSSREDAAYEALVHWIEHETTGGEDPAPLDPAERLFGDRVQPLLLGRGCAQTNCHGETSFVPYRLDPGVPGGDERARLGIAATRANYEATRPLLAVDARPGQSRLLRKILPLADGGIPHRGGNDTFIGAPPDRLVEAIEDWVAHERARAGGHDPSATAIAFVRGVYSPGGVHAPRGFSADDRLMLRSPASSDGEDIDLSDLLPDGGGGHIGGLAAAPDGDALVVAYQPSRRAARRLFLLDLDERASRALTGGPDLLANGEPVVDDHPAIGRDGRVYFSSNRHGEEAERGGDDYELYRVPLEGGDPLRLTYTPSPELAPAAFRVGPFRDYLVFSVRRAVHERDETIGFSFPYDRHVDYHIFFGVTANPRRLIGFRELPDGRAVTTSVASDAQWDIGRLAIVDRNLGPDLVRDESGDVASLPAYRPTYRELVSHDAVLGSERGAPRPLGGLARAAVLPDGALLAARAPPDFDSSRVDSPPDLAIVRVELDSNGGVESECRGGRCDVIGARMEAWIDAPGLADHSPTPLVVRTGSASREEALDPAAPSLFSMVDVTVNDAVMERLAPRGARPFRDDVAYVRLVEAVSRPVALSTQAGVPERSASSRQPARVLAELPVAADGSIYARVPPNTPFRTQLLDEARMNIGVQHNRWLFVWPGQHFSQSTHRRLYDQRCAGCHGSSSGLADALLTVPDVTTRATLTLARFENSNPYVPREPQVVDQTSAVSVDYLHDVEPIIRRRCRECHGVEPPAAGGVDLSGAAVGEQIVAYKTLVGPDADGGNTFVDVAGTSARTSRLIELATGRELDAPGDPSSHVPVEVPDDEVLTLVRWIETGAHFEIPREP